MLIFNLIPWKFFVLFWLIRVVSRLWEECIIWNKLISAIELLLLKKRETSEETVATDQYIFQDIWMNDLVSKNWKKE